MELFLLAAYIRVLYELPFEILAYIEQLWDLRVTKYLKMSIWSNFDPKGAILFFAVGFGRYSPFGTSYSRPI